MTILPLSLSEVAYEAGGRTLLECDLSIRSGPATMVLGPNGAGKSIFLRLCHGLLQPTRGHIDWRGTEDGNPTRKQAMVFQKPVMLRRSVAANIAYGLKIHGIERSIRDRRVDEILQRTGLRDTARRSALSLSGGEQQRLALGRAWALEPDILFLDEPTANLDPGSMAAVETIICDIQKAGTKIVMTTHDLGQAKRLAGDVIFLYRGQVKERADVARFFESPESREATAYLKGELLW